MRGGLFLGIVWGVLVSAVVLAAMSLSMPLPPRPGTASETGAAPAPAQEASLSEDAASEDTEQPEAATDAPRVGETDDLAGAAEGVPLPAGSSFNQPPPEEPAVLPETDAPVALDATVASDDAAPSAEASVRPSPDSAPAPQPDIAATPVQPVAPSTGAGLSVVASGEADAVPEGAPQAPADAVADDAPAALDTSPADEPEAVAEAPVAQDDAETDTAAALPQITPDTGDSTEEVSVAPAPGGRLPQIEPSAPASEPEAEEDAAAEPETDAEAEAEATPPEADTPSEPNALRDNAVAFEGTPDQALIAIVLIDDPDGGLTADTLTRFTFPVAFAIDPLSDGAAERAGTYRAAGFEVVIWADILPEGATPDDVAQVFEGAAQVLPEAVAVMDSPEGRLQGDRPILDAAVNALGRSGHGLVAFPQGLNAAEQTARRADVPAATLFRQLDDEDQRATIITRFLTRAGFAAGENGTVVVAGRTRPDTVTALFSWALGDRSSNLAIAPLSAVLQRNAEN